MELMQEGKIEGNAQKVISFNKAEQCTRPAESRKDVSDQGQGLGLVVDKNVEAPQSPRPTHNPTSEFVERSSETDVGPENSAKDRPRPTPENSTLVATELSILPLIDVGLGPKPKKQFQADNISSLSVIANYGSSSESDSDSYSDNNRYFKPTLVVASTPSVISSSITGDYRSIQHSSTDESESDSESSDDESSSSSSTDDRATPTSRNSRVAAPKSVKKKAPVRIRDPLDDLPPIEDLQISVPEDACLEVGFISSIVDQQVIIQAKKGIPALDLGSILFLEKGKRTLGEIFDVFGQVTEPFYSVRFNSADHVQEKGIEKGLVVYCAPQTEHTNYVFVQQLMKLKASDPSWEYTEDPPPDCIDYSDDEEECNNLRGKRNVNRDHSDLDTEPTPRKRVNSFERRMNERNLRKSALPLEPGTVSAGAVRSSVRGRRHLAVGRNAFAKSHFGFNHFPAGRGRAMTISFGGLPPSFGAATIGNQRMGSAMNFGPIQPPNLTLPPPNSYGPIQPPSLSVNPQANGQPCAIMGMRPNGPPADYMSPRPLPGCQQPPVSHSANTNQPPPMHHLNSPPPMQCPVNSSQPHRAQHSNTGSPHPNSHVQHPSMQHPNNNGQLPHPHHNTGNQLPSMQHSNTNKPPPAQLHPNAQPLGYVPPQMQFSPYIPPTNRPRVDNSDGQYPRFGVLGFMPPQTFQGRPQNNSFFNAPPPGFGTMPSFPGGIRGIRPQAFQPMYSQMPPMFYPEFQPPQLPPGALPNTMTSMYSRPPPAPPNGGV